MKKDFESISISVQSSLLQAMQQMDRLDGKLLIVADQNQKYLSVISIGDIQRYLIKHQNIEANVSAALRPTVRNANVHDSVEEIKKIMLQYRTEFMPVLNDNGELDRVVFWEEIFDTKRVEQKSNLDIPVVIMAGGKGARLKPITNVIPKPLVPLGEKPILQIIMEQFAALGSRRFWLSVNYKAQMIKQFVSDTNKDEFEVNYLEEQIPLGTAGSLSLLKGKVDEPFFISNCDILIDQDYEEVFNWHVANKNDITSVAAIKNYHIPYGTLEVEKNGLLKALKEKPDMTFLVNAGVYIIEPKLLSQIPKGEVFHITNLMDKVKKSGGRVGVFPVSEGAWLDIGNWVEYNKTQEIYSKRFG